MIKLIACDVDGTLLLNGNKEISDKLFEQIKKLKKRGILFTVASGRQYKNLQYLFNPIKNDIAYICDDGCLAFYKNKILYQNTLSPELAYKIAEKAYEFENCEVQISTADIQYLMVKSDTFYQYMKQEPGLKIKKIKNVQDVKEPIIKVAVYNPVFSSHINNLRNLFENECSIALGRCDWINFLPKNVNKGLALDALLCQLNISAADCVAFGDYYNDVSMFKIAGVAIAMNNAPDDVKKSANKIIDSVEKEMEHYS